MTVAESKSLKEGSRVYWRGDANDSGRITETSWDAVTIAWDNGQWPPYTMATCAKSSERRHAGVLGRGSRNIVRNNPLPDTWTPSWIFAIRGFKPGP